MGTAARKCAKKVSGKRINRLQSGHGGGQINNKLEEFKFAAGRKKQYGLRTNEIKSLLMTQTFTNSTMIEAVLNGMAHKERTGGIVPGAPISVRKSTIHKHTVDRVSWEGTHRDLVDLHKYLQKKGINLRLRTLRVWNGEHMYSFNTAPRAMGDGNKATHNPAWGKTVVLTGIDGKNVSRYSVKRVEALAAKLGCSQCTMLKTEARIHCDFA
jgi:hypothetical protein